MNAGRRLGYQTKRARHIVFPALPSVFFIEGWSTCSGANTPLNVILLSFERVLNRHYPRVAARP